MLEEKRTDIGLSRMEYKLENDRIKETQISSLSFWSLEGAIESMKRKKHAAYDATRIRFF